MMVLHVYMRGALSPFFSLRLFLGAQHRSVDHSCSTHSVYINEYRPRGAGGKRNVMKKFLLLLVVVFAVINISAQEQVIHYKKNAKKTFFRVTTEGKSDEYYSTFNSKNGKIIPNFSANNKFYKNGYDKINVTENILEMESEDIEESYLHKDDDIVNKSKYRMAFAKCDDSKDISARAIGIISTSSKLEVGNCYQLLKVTKAEDKSLVGCDVICQVIESRKSNISGSEGRLTLRPICIEKHDGTQVRLQPTDIQRRGLNRTNVKTWTSFLIIPAFIPGSCAKITPNEAIDLRLE